MEIARLALDYIKTLAWPGIVLFIALTFRDEFRELLNRLKEVKGGGFDASFEERVLEAQVAVEAAAEQEVPTSEPQEGRHENPFDAIRSVSDQLPEATVISAFSLVEQKIKEAVHTTLDPAELGRLPRHFDAMAPAQLIPLLERAGLTPLAVQALQNLRVLRNQAAQRLGETDAATACTYADTAELGTRLLDSFIAHHRRPDAA